jgi:sulfatase modifying factor 1
MKMNGDRIDQYTVIRLLGKGGMSEVYLVEDNLGRRYALKVLSARLTGDYSFRERFKTEARIMASLNHPNIVGLHSYFEEQGNYCLAMDYLEGGSLKDLIRRTGPLPESQALEIFWQIAQALAHAHSQGIIHRDVKPSNILISGSGSYKLGDFGIARMKESEGLTRTGSRMGTLIYMSPEQIKDSKHVDAKTDVYSLGVLLYEMLTGRAPYNENEDSEYDIINMIVRQDLPDPRKYSPRLSKETLEIFKMATRKDPGRRPEARELLPKRSAAQPHPNDSEPKTEIKPSSGLSQSDANRGKVLSQPKKMSPGLAVLILLVLLTLTTGIYSLVEYVLAKQEIYEEEYPEPEPLTDPTADSLSHQTKVCSIPMVYVQGGNFYMGSNDGGGDEQPVHQVRVSSFYIGKYEVTQAQWREVMGGNPSFFKGDDLPVEQVTWYDAVDFCNRLSRMEGLTPCYSGSGDDTTCDWSANGYRLPTEAEWEYAARGGNGSQGYTYSGSNDPGNVAWFDENSGYGTHSVGEKRANELGLYDMSGNVWEWCWDWYDARYYSSCPGLDPRGVDSDSVRVLRGGNCYDSAARCRVSFRDNVSPYGRGDGGFRLARAIP